MITVEFRCGAKASIDPDKTPSPVCECGPACRVARVHGVRAPRFVGLAAGPHATTQRLEAIPVSLAAVPLSLKPQDLPAPKGAN